jgi:hypothetical protein
MVLLSATSTIEAALGAVDGDGPDLETARTYARRQAEALLEALP